MSREFSYCPLCGKPLEAASNEGYTRMRCPSCGYVHYRNPAPAVGVLVVEDGRVLLVKRRFDPYRGLWSIPSGFIEYDEDVRSTGVREALEETGLAVEIVSLHAVESCFDDPRGNTLLVLYRARVTGGTLAAGDDAEEVRFFPLGDLPPIAFEAHRKVLAGLAGNVTRLL
ncbi:MAG TPA: NUDIX hydrolase [Candidatus Bathyarchaeia archaeon]|nr:NUDIX hydrolase [Candidatus Bathyarchaeia archaeon]